MALKEIKKKNGGNWYLHHFPHSFHKWLKYSYDEFTFREDVVSVHLEYLTPSLETPNPEPHTLSTTFHTISLPLFLSHSFLQSFKLTPIAPMAAGLSASVTSKPFRLFQHSHLLKPTTLFAPSVLRHSTIKKNQKKSLLNCLCDLGGPKTKDPVGES